MIHYRFFSRKLLGICRKHIYFCIVLSIMVCFVTYIEIISYWINTNQWSQLQCIEPTKCLRILLVADPQITGHEHLEILTSLAQHDIDSYLKKTYLHAYDFVKPNITIFLGDLMDEGSIATDEEYEEYSKRFFRIFPKNGHDKQIWLPGDNDIGGEGVDRVDRRKMQRYNNIFDQADMLDYGTVTFVKVNRMAYSFPNLKRKADLSKTIVILSHMPLMFMPSAFSEKILSLIKPEVIFTAHEHKAMIISAKSDSRYDRHIVPQTPEDNKIHRFNLHSRDFYEIMVPTCSYRMGTFKIGYGSAILENGELQYTVLWSVSRYHQFWTYKLMFVLILISFIIVKFNERIYENSVFSKF